jgi:cation diffusion facilitator family transporter
MSHTNAQQEKLTAALSSVVAAVGLTTFKIIVGILTNSLGILAEAAHSALDLAAALMTFFAVHMADKPADKEHNFGHGKIENLSALFETILLLATSAWIFNEAVDRLFFRKAQVEISIWSFIVMGTSIAVDYTRSRILYRAAKKYNSQALEADALHFSTDIWSSSVVILGLVGVTISHYMEGLNWMSDADAVAAMLVALIVIFISGELGWRTVNALLDTAPKGMTEKIIAEVGKMKGINDCHAVRIRPSGAYWFVDLHVTMDGDTSLTNVHDMTEKIERKVHKLLPGSDVTVHVEPLEMAET